MNDSDETKAFHFKQFSIYQNSCGMQVSTDGVMLGAWVNTRQDSRILDIGCGTGLLSLMAAQRFNNARITAIDIAADAVIATRLNVANSPWLDRIDVMHQDLLDQTFNAEVDCIVCNPPYFTNGEAALCPSRATARHAKNYFHNTLADRAQQLLTVAGSASFILPAIEAEMMIEYAQSQGWFLSRCCKVKTTPAKPVSRILFELSRKRPAAVNEETLVIQENGGYSEPFIRLTRDFYLKM